MLTVNTHLLCFELGYYQCLLYWTLFLSYVKSGGAMVLGASWQSGAPVVTSETWEWVSVAAQMPALTELYWWLSVYQSLLVVWMTCQAQKLASLNPSTSAVALWPPNTLHPAGKDHSIRGKSQVILFPLNLLSILLLRPRAFASLLAGLQSSFVIGASKVLLLWLVLAESCLWRYCYGLQILWGRSWLRVYV